MPAELVDLLFNTDEYRYEVRVINEDGWHRNGMKYSDWVAAANGALGLARRWILVEAVKVIAA